MVCGYVFPLKIKGTDLTILDFSHKFESYIIFKNNENERLTVINQEHNKNFFLTNDPKFDRLGLNLKMKAISEKDLGLKNENNITNKLNALHSSEEIEKPTLKNKIDSKNNDNLNQSLSAQTQVTKFKTDRSRHNSAHFTNLNEIKQKLNFEETTIPSIFIESKNVNEIFRISILNKENKFFISELLNKNILLKISQPLQFNKQMNKIKLIKGNLRISLTKTNKKFTMDSLSNILCFCNHFLFSI